jgi:hypothetical protein
MDAFYGKEYREWQGRSITLAVACPKTADNALNRQPFSVMFTMVLISPPRSNRRSVIDNHI